MLNPHSSNPETPWKYFNIFFVQFQPFVSSELHFCNFVLNSEDIYRWAEKMTNSFSATAKLSAASTTCQDSSTPFLKSKTKNDWRKWFQYEVKYCSLDICLKCVFFSDSLLLMFEDTDASCHREGCAELLSTKWLLNSLVNKAARCRWCGAEHCQTVLLKICRLQIMKMKTENLQSLLKCVNWTGSLLSTVKLHTCQCQCTIGLR